MTASKKINVSAKAKAIQEKKALNRALKKIELDEFTVLTSREHEAISNHRAKQVEVMKEIFNAAEADSTTLTMRLPKVIADSLTEEDILMALNNFVNDFNRAEEMKKARTFIEAGEIQKSFLQRAEALIKGDRQKDYGDKLANFAHIAMFFQAVLAPKLSPGQRISPEEVGMMMQGVKMARMIKSPDHADSVLDNAGYAGCIGELQAERLALKTPTGAIVDSNSWMIPDVGN